MKSNALIQQFIPEIGPKVLPAKHYEWFKLANSHPITCWKKIFWFTFKEKFLARFAIRDGYDMQIIKHPCWNCEDGSCGRCNDGIYLRVEVPLERWQFPNGDIYHRPDRTARPQSFKSEFHGTIKHREVSERSAVHAALRLAFRYDRELFIRIVRLHYGDLSLASKLKTTRDRIKWRLYNARIRLHNRFFPPSEQDVPF